MNGSMVATEADPRGEATITERRATVIASLGNVLEWYDFTVYGFLAVIVAKHFFPAGGEGTSLLAAFAAFGVGFLARPLGGIILGRVGDVKGRRFVLLFTMFLMAVASLVIGICPTYETIGIAAPIVLVVARLAQGFSAGGEWGGAAAFLVEWARPGRRGIVGSFHQIGAFGGLLMGSIIVAAITSTITSEAFQSWGWRVPFIIGALLGIVVMYIRRHVQETPVFRAAQSRSTPIRPQSEGAFTPLMQAMGLIVLWTVSVYGTFVYLTTFTQKYGGLTRPEALWSNTIGLMVVVALAPVAGALSDRIGRRATMGMGASGFLILVVPLYSVIAGGAAFPTVIGIQTVFAILTALVVGPGPAAISELFATKSRNTWMSIGAAVSTAIFGGFAPFISTFLIESTGIVISAAFYVLFAAIVTGITILTMRETAFAKLRE
jgi:MHS family proline/betaine transporter-like MFS transporter